MVWKGYRHWLETESIFFQSTAAYRNGAGLTMERNLCVKEWECTGSFAGKGGFDGCNFCPGACLLDSRVCGPRSDDYGLLHNRSSGRNEARCCRQTSRHITRRSTAAAPSLVDSVTLWEITSVLHHDVLGTGQFNVQRVVPNTGNQPSNRICSV